MEMEVSDFGDNVRCIRLRGRLDAPGADVIETRFTAAVTASSHHTAVDLSGVSFLASMGIRMFIICARAAKAKGSTVVLFGATELVQGVIDHAALGQIIPVVSTEEQALARLRH